MNWLLTETTVLALVRGLSEALSVFFGAEVILDIAYGINKGGFEDFYLRAYFRMSPAKHCQRVQEPRVPEHLLDRKAVSSMMLVVIHD